MADSTRLRLPKRRLVRLAVFSAMLLVCWLVVSTTLAYRLTRRPRAWFSEPAPNVAWAAIENVRLRTSDGQDIGGWFVDAAPDAPSVLVLHGNKGSRANSITRGEFLARAGDSVLMISLRSHGDSMGETNDFGFSARNDVDAAVRFLEQRRPGSPIVVLGTSLGSAAAVFASEILGHRVQGYILESPYKDLKTAVWNRTDTYMPPILSTSAYGGLRLMGPIFLPHLEDIAPSRAIGAIPEDVPVLIIAGAVDKLARPEEARVLHSNVAGHGELVFFSNAGHQDLFGSEPDRYKKLVLGFCESARQGKAGPADRPSSGDVAR